MKYHNITKDDFLNGDGIRAVLFVSGCTHACPECQNPITWNKNEGLEFDAAAKEELFTYLQNDYVSGITFSGGDPLAPYNREEVLALMEEVKEKFPNKTIWCYTGYTKDQLIMQNFWEKLKPNLDVLVEGEFKITLRSVPYHWAGSLNQRILRKETDFAINTSDPIYEAFIEIKDLIPEGPIKVLYEEIFSIICTKLNPDCFIKDALELITNKINAFLLLLKDTTLDLQTSDTIKEHCENATKAITERLRMMDMIEEIILFKDHENFVISQKENSYDYVENQRTQLTNELLKLRDHIKETYNISDEMFENMRKGFYINTTYEYQDTFEIEGDR